MTSKNTYRLVNPYIEGTMDQHVKASNSFNAGKKLYKQLSQHFTTHVKNFFMTLQKMDTNELYHFKINEQRGGDEVDFSIEQIPGAFKSDVDDELLQQISKLDNQSGGRKHKKKHHFDDDDDDDDSDSDSDSDEYINYLYMRQPITRFIYYYLPYYRIVGMNPIDASRIYVPLFGFPQSPNVEVRLDFYRFQ